MTRPWSVSESVGQPLKRINPAQTDCHVVISELRNRSGQPFGEVSRVRNADPFLSCPGLQEPDYVVRQSVFLSGEQSCGNQGDQKSEQD